MSNEKTELDKVKIAYASRRNVWFEYEGKWTKRNIETDTISLMFGADIKSYSLEDPTPKEPIIPKIEGYRLVEIGLKGTAFLKYESQVFNVDRCLSNITDEPTHAGFVFKERSGYVYSWRDITHASRHNRDGKLTRARWVAFEEVK